MNSKKWIKEALKHSREGALHRQLGIPKDENIPVGLLIKIKNTPIGQTIHFPGIRQIKVTLLLKRRAVLALNLR